MAGKSLPVVNSVDREYWEAAARGELRLQKCRTCGVLQFFPRIACTGCLGGDLEWVQVSGKGKVHTFSLCRVPRNRAFMDEVPIYVAEVELDEGVRMITRIVGDNRDQVTLARRLRSRSWTPRTPTSSCRCSSWPDPRPGA